MKADSKALFKALQEVSELKGDTLRLPMPRRIELPAISQLKSLMFGPFWQWIEEEASKDQPKSDIMYKMSKNEAFLAHLDAIGMTFASMNITLIGIRHKMLKAPIMTVSESLSALLDDTNISDDVPAKFFTPPFKATYIEFNSAEFRENAKLQVDDSGILSCCEGCYVQEHIYDVFPNISIEAINTLELDSKKPVRLIDIGFTASPFNNPNIDSAMGKAAYDSMDFASIYIQDEDEPIKDILQRHFLYFRERLHSNPLLNKEHADRFEKMFSENFSFLSKVLFYIHIERKEQRKVQDATDLEKRINSVADKKKEKLKKQLNRVYDHIVIGPQSYVPLNERVDASNVPKGMKSPHHRRGTIGIRWVGSGQNKKATLVRIKESLVNKHLLSASATVKKDYVIK